MLFSIKEVFSLCFLFGTILVSGNAILFLKAVLNKLPNKNFLIGLISLLLVHSLYLFIIYLMLSDSKFLKEGFPIILLYGPATYGITEIIIKGVLNIKKFAKHLIPFFFFSIGFLLLAFKLFVFEFYYYINILYVFSGVQLGVYVFVSVNSYQAYFRAEKSNRLKNKFFNYLFILAGLTSLIFILTAINNILSQGLNLKSEESSMICFMMLCASSLFHWSIFSFRKSEILLDSERTIWPTTTQLLEASNKETKKYGKTLKDKDFLELVKIKIVNIPLEAYLDEKLTLRSFSNMINEQRSNVSQTLNIHMQTNFNRFVNHKRVIHAENLLLDPSKNRSIIDIAYLSGFKSESSFYRIFKDIHNCSPKQFREKNILRPHENNIFP